MGLKVWPREAGWLLAKWPRRAAPVALAIWLALFTGGFGSAAAAPGEAPGPLTVENLIDQQLEGLSLDSIHRFVDSLDAETREHVPAPDVRRLISEGDGIDWGGLARSLVGVFVSEVRVNISLLGQLVLLGVFCALLHHAASAFKTAEAGEVAFFVSLLVLLLLGLQAFSAAAGLAAEAMRNMLDLMQALLPLLATMLAAAGAVTSAAIFHPLIYTTVTAIAALIDGALVPVVTISAVLAVLGSVSKEFPVKQLEGLVRTGVLTALGMVFIAFFAVVQVRGAIAPIADGFAFRTAKFLTGAFVPVVGGRIADAMDVIVGGSVLIKNALGVFGMGAIAVVTAFPAVKIFAILAVFRAATALIEPITDPRLVQALSGLAGSISLLLAGLITASLMFFVAVTVVVGVGNTAALMR